MVPIGYNRPDYIRLGIVCMSLSHRMNRTGSDPQSSILSKTFLRFRGLIIRSLSEDIKNDNKRMSDGVIAGILTLLLADVSRSYVEKG
jgi:hypothetical protein